MADEEGSLAQEWEDNLRTLRVLAEKRGYADFELQTPWQKLAADIFLVATAAEVIRRQRPVAFVVVTTPQLSVKSLRHIQKWAAETSEEKNAHVLVLSHKGLTPFADKELHQTRATQPLEVFTKAQLAFPVVHHRLVPSHEAMSPRSTAALLRKFKCSLASFPKIHLADPVVRFMGFPRGTMVKITRCLGNLEPQLYYRVVV
jgi:DNA-directed RNA polymerase I, II, and III subunit RPABC1